MRTLAGGSWPTWNVDGYVYLSGGDGVVRVPSTGGSPEPVYELADGEAGGRGVGLLPGGRTALLEVGDGAGGEVRLLDLESGQTEPLTPGQFPRYVPSGHIVYLLGGQLMAARFDADEGALVGPPVALDEGVAAHSVSNDGKLFYSRGVGGARWEFVWVTRSGQATPVHAGHSFNMTNANRGWRLSPDETRIVFNSQVDGMMDVRIKHLPDGPEERITFTEEVDYRPFWTPDGQSVTYFSGPDAQDRNVWGRRADGTGEPTLLLDDERSFTQGAWSPDGELLVLRAGATVAMGIGLRDIYTFRPGVDSAAVPLVATTDFAEGAPEISPDGRWLAYASNETGRDEVFVRPFPDVDSGRVRVSTDGGLAPLWSKDGRELFYTDANRGFVVTGFDPAAGEVLTRETLFTIPVDYEAETGNNAYDVTLDGERFLMARAYGGEGEDEGPRFILVQNFFEELRQRVPN